MDSNFTLGEFVVVNFNWDDYRLNHRIRIATITKIYEADEACTFNGRTFKPVIVEACDIKYSNTVYTYKPYGKTLFTKFRDFKIQLDLIENNVNNQVKDLNLLKQETYGVLME